MSDRNLSEQSIGNQKNAGYTKYLGWQNAIFICVNMKRTMMTLFVTVVPAVSMHWVWGGEQEKKYSKGHSGARMQNISIMD
eukprot:scaffold214989_cov39-Attheya_sp.AAC.1